MPLCIYNGTRSFNGRFQDIRKVRIFLAQLERAARDPRDVQQIIEQQRHVVNLPGDDIVAPASLRVGRILRLRYQGRLSNGRQRIAQFVRESCQKFVLAAVGLAQRGFNALALRDVPGDF